jgi:hypothetical protein
MYRERYSLAVCTRKNEISSVVLRCAASMCEYSIVEYSSRTRCVLMRTHVRSVLLLQSVMMLYILCTVSIVCSI